MQDETSKRNSSAPSSPIPTYQWQVGTADLPWHTWDMHQPSACWYQPWPWKRWHSWPKFASGLGTSAFQPVLNTQPSQLLKAEHICINGWDLTNHLTMAVQDEQPCHLSEPYLLTNVARLLAGHACHLLLPRSIASHWQVFFLKSQHIFIFPLLLVLIMPDCVIWNSCPRYLQPANICRLITLPVSHHFTKLYVFFPH